MMRQTLRDARSFVVGYITLEPGGRQILTDVADRRLGYFDPRDNVTIDASYRRVGTGNLLTSLLPIRR